jgi:hypothetical protein
MVERAGLDPTIDEIVVALRETTRDASRAPHFTVVGRQTEVNWLSGMDLLSGKTPTTSRSRSAPGRQGSTAIGDLRDSEIERLLMENARLNERVVFLLKVVEREQASKAESQSERTLVRDDREALLRDVRAAVESELRPVMLVVLELMKRQRTEPGGEVTAIAGPGPAELAAAFATLSQAAALEHDNERPVPAPKPVEIPVTATPPLRLRERAARALDALRS